MVARQPQAGWHARVCFPLSAVTWQGLCLRFCLLLLRPPSPTTTPPTLVPAPLLLPLKNPINARIRSLCDALVWCFSVAFCVCVCIRGFYRKPESPSAVTMTEAVSGKARQPPRLTSSSQLIGFVDQYRPSPHRGAKIRIIN